MKLPHLILVMACFAFVPYAPAFAAGDAPKPPDKKWSFDGPFGMYDKAAKQRGLKVYREVCAACHSLKKIYFRNFEALGYNEDQVKNIAAEYTVRDGPNEEGEMFERAAIPSDAFPSPFPNDKAAAYANGGALPPDLSLITKARINGADYLHALLNGYVEPPEGAEVVEGKYWNKYFPGHNISMAAPLVDGQVSYEDGTPQTVDQYADDLAQFLMWTADPHMEERKRTGLRVLIFLIVFAGVMYAVKRRIWAHLHDH